MQHPPNAGTAPRLPRRAAALALRLLLAAWGLTAIVRADSGPAAAPASIVVIGATARTAQLFIPLALEQGYKVVGLARRPDAVSIKHERFTVMQSDVYDLASIQAALRGDEVVVSLYGPRITDMTAEIPDSDLLSAGHRNIITAMKLQGNTRLITVSSTGAQYVLEKQPGDDAPRQLHWLWQIRGIYNDMRRMEQLVRESGLDYTIVRPAQLMNEPARNDIRFGVDSNVPDFTLITYPDFAAYLLSQVTGNTHVGHTVGLYSDRKLQYGVNFDVD